MGFFKALINSGTPKGIRELVYSSYEEGLAKVRLDRTDDSKPYWKALYHVQRVFNGNPKKHSRKEYPMFAELAPFLILKPDVGVKAFAEYKVYSNGMADCDLAWLKKVLNRSITVVLTELTHESVIQSFVYCCEVPPYPLWPTGIIDTHLMALLIDKYRIEDYYEQSNLPSVFNKS